MSGARSGVSDAARDGARARPPAARRRAAPPASSGRTRGASASPHASRHPGRRRCPRYPRRSRHRRRRTGSGHPIRRADIERRSSPPLGAASTGRRRPPSRSRRVGGSGGAWKSPWPAAAGAPPAVEHDVVGLAVVAATDEDRLSGGANLFARAHVDERQSTGVVDGGAEIDCETGGAQRPTETDRLVSRRRPSISGPQGALTRRDRHRPACCDSATTAPRLPNGPRSRRGPWTHLDTGPDVLD